MTCVLHVVSNLGVAFLAPIQNSSSEPSGAIGCLRLLLLSLLSFFTLKARCFRKQSGKGQPDS